MKLYLVIYWITSSTFAANGPAKLIGDDTSENRRDCAGYAYDLNRTGRLTPPAGLAYRGYLAVCEARAK